VGELELSREELIKVKREKPAATPRADRPDGGNLLSALGNARVQRLLRSAALQRKGLEGGESVDDDVAKSIQAKQGTGQALDETARRDLGPALGDDFSDVRVHTDSEADHLNRAVSAEAFTTGSDIFFRSGSYNPGSRDGKKLLAHELTHVVQQRGAPPADDFTVSSPGDASERQASAVADTVNATGGPAAAVSRQAAPEEEEMMQASVAREAAPEEEEEPPPMSAVAREAAPEEEELMQASLAREAAPEEEEEMMQASLAREAAPEEEEMMQASIDRADVPEEDEVPTQMSQLARAETVEKAEQPA